MQTLKKGKKQRVRIPYHNIYQFQKINFHKYIQLHAIAGQTILRPVITHMKQIFYDQPRKGNSKHIIFVLLQSLCNLKKSYSNSKLEFLSHKFHTVF